MKKMMVKLRNSGIEELRTLVNIVYMSLKKLLKEEPDAFYDTVMITRDENYRSSGISRETLVKLGFIDSNNQMHDSTRNIVLACVEGDMMKMRLVNPIMKE